MPREICLLHANCQGDALRPLLEASEDFSRCFEIRQYTNYTRQQLADEDLEHCRLFLHQHLAPAWGNLSSQQLLARLPDGADAICLPNFFFKGYWPFWTNAIKKIEFADALLESLLERGLGSEAALHLYLRADAGLLGNVENLIEDSLAYERRKEEYTPIKYVDLIEQNWRREQLFLTVNHPGLKLLAHLANSILQILGFARLPQEVLAGYQHPQDEFWLPIHPGIGARFGLDFAAPHRMYPCFGAGITHREYVNYYLACRDNGIADLTGVLKDRAERLNSSRSGE